jgi:hypothetical protein
MIARPVLVYRLPSPRLRRVSQTRYILAAVHPRLGQDDLQVTEALQEWNQILFRYWYGDSFPSSKPLRGIRGCRRKPHCQTAEPARLRHPATKNLLLLSETASPLRPSKLGGCSDLEFPKGTDNETSLMVHGIELDCRVRHHE